MLARLGHGRELLGGVDALERLGQFVFFRFPYDGGAVRFEGRATKDRIVGKVTTPDGSTHPWRALRAGQP